MRGTVGPLLGSAIFFVIAPGTVAGLVPWWISRGRIQPPFLGWAGIPGAGAALILGGILMLLDCFARFALEGRGTPAPPLPTQRLVVSGAYLYVRNPMYLAVSLLILGQALLFGSRALLWYAGCVGLAFHAFVVLYEEPTLRSRHPREYATYCAHVPRWRPRARPWRGGGTSASEG